MPELKEHECNLQDQKEDVVNRRIETGIFIGARRKFRSWCIINRSHPEALKYFKSHSACYEEQIRHMSKAYYMIHPFSLLNLFSECFFIYIFSVNILLIAINAVAEYRYRGFIMLCRIIADVFEVIDIIKLFFTGYYDKKSNTVILNPLHICKRYLRTYFFFDIISCVYTLTIPLSDIEGLTVPSFLKVFRRASSRLKILRIFRCRKTLDIFRQYMDYTDHIFTALKTFYTYMMLVIWAFSCFFILNSYMQELTKMQEETLMYNHTKILAEICYDATLLLQLISFGRYDKTEILEFTTAIFFLCYGFTMQLYMLAQLLQVWCKYESKETQNYTLLKQFEEYVQYKNLPSRSRERIYDYYQFKLRRHYFKQFDIENMISPLMRQEILLHDTRSYVARVEFFKSLPEHILINIVTKLKTEVFLPGDVIITAGLVGNNMYFIHYGTVAVYTPDGKEVCHLTDGAHFGEIALILSEKRIATIVTVSPSEVFMLTSKDFASVIDPYPEIKKRLIEMATESLKKSQSELKSSR